MLAIDTNVLVRLIVNDDPAQASVAQAKTARGAWISHLVLAECIWVLGGHFSLSRANVVNAVEALLTHPNLAFEDANVVRAALQHFARRRGIEFSDCLIFEIARKAGHTPLGTFDRDFAKLDGVELL